MTEYFFFHFSSNSFPYVVFLFEYQVWLLSPCQLSTVTWWSFRCGNNNFRAYHFSLGAFLCVCCSWVGSPAFPLCTVPLANTVMWIWQRDEKEPLLTKDFQGSAVFSVQEQRAIKLVPRSGPILLIPAVFSYQARPVSEVFKVPKYPQIWKHAVMLFCSTFLSWTPEKLSEQLHLNLEKHRN